MLNRNFSTRKKNFSDTKKNPTPYVKEVGLKNKNKNYLITYLPDILPCTKYIIEYLIASIK